MYSQSPSQILLTLVDKVASDEEENRVLSYTELQDRLTALGIEIEEGQSPEAAYKQAERHFRKSQSFCDSEVRLVPAVKENAG